MADEDAIDWARIGRNIRQARIIRGHSQEEFAAMAKLSITTLFHIEKGRPISRTSLIKVSAALQESLDSLKLRNRVALADEADCRIFRRSQGLWTVELETRAKVPEDDLRRIQDPSERLRLGRLGLVIGFFCTTNFIMPDGPGVVFIELYRRLQDQFNAIIYRDCLLTCTRGRARVGIGDTVVEMDEGDVVGYHSKDLTWMEPAEPVGQDGLPTILTWTGAVRLGGRPIADTSNKRVRRRKKPTL